MKIEKISDTQIRCTLNRTDLQSRELKISELAYGTEKAKDLFHDMIEQASHQFGFEADDLPLMIEAIPVSADCIILNITKVEDPEELDTRFSRFAPSDEINEPDGAENLDYEDIYALAKEIKDEDIELLGNILHNVDNFIPMKDTIKSLSSDTTTDDTNNDKPSEVLPLEPVNRLFSFKSFSEASTASLGVRAEFTGISKLFKENKSGIYYLLLTNYAEDASDFLKLCNEITEYGKKETVTYSTVAYLNEHCDLIIKENALNILKEY